VDVYRPNHCGLHSEHLGLSTVQRKMEKIYSQDTVFLKEKFKKKTLESFLHND